MPTTPLTLPFSGRKLRELRERKGMFQEDLAARCQETGTRVSRASISRYELGNGKPAPRNFVALVAALGCADVDLLDEPPAVKSAA